MIKVCAKHGRECWTFQNREISKAIFFARIGSQTGTDRTVTLCDRRVRTYRKGKKTAGAKSMTALRHLARRCGL